jgi:hypothetical protein
MFESRFSWKHPYGWRTHLRTLLPRQLCWFVDKGKDCEIEGAQHYWYNKDNENSACYYCRVIRRGQLWNQAPN